MSSKSKVHAAAAQIRPVYTVDQFCEIEEISRPFLYRAWKRNGGPDYMQMGARRRITEEARQEYHTKLLRLTSEQRALASGETAETATA
jgi:hypothetical protein